MNERHRNGPAARRVPAVARRDATATIPGLETPTRAQLERHAKRFPDSAKAVLQVAAEFGITVDVEVPKAEAKVKGIPLKTQIRELLDVNPETTVDTVAETFNLSPSRARRLMDEIGGE